MSDKRRVVITGTGALSALGATTHELWNGLLANRSGVRRVKRLVDSGINVTTGGEVDAISPQDVDRDHVIANRAIDDALAESKRDAAECAFIWSTGLDTFQLGHEGFVHRSAGRCFSNLASRFSGPRRMIAAACASGTQAIGEAFRLIQKGRLDACVAGGSSVMLTPFYLIGFAGLQAVAIDNGDDPSLACRPFDKRRKGFALADGAGAVVLETHESAVARGARVFAEVIGFGVSQDAFDLNRPCDDGAGAELCMRRALADAVLSSEEIDAVNAHATATYSGDLAEAAALRKVFAERWQNVPVSGSKGAIGHAMAAAGVLEAIVAAQTCATGIVPPTVNLQQVDDGCELDHVIGEPRDVNAKTVLSVSFGMGGQNAGVILRRVSHG
ncbi:MAG TPA: beta-ketoacyl-[acyl-carrier-protein] synthase family protein [Pyrinomonadaceae bacterium]|nr:beta-ketoacyl-[acyl-carrier-protein] synthase family protein [Pyrinomonadaceae bacterium]